MEVGRRRLLRWTGVGAAVGGAVGLGVLGLGSSTSTTVDALVAGSLDGLARAVPGASVEAHGSLAAVRLVEDGLRNPDVLALADPTLFAGIVDAVTIFASNALVVTYDPDSPHAPAIREDWASALADPAVRVGRTDPESDPLGYRTVMALRLADRLGIADTDLVDRARIFPETALTQQVAVGKLDAAFTYRSMAVERDLPAIELPDRIDFSNPEFTDTYRSVSLELDARTVRGAPIQYGAAHLTAAGEDWMTDLVDGVDRLEAHGFTRPKSLPRRRSV